ncbi:hypothetical protein BEH94_07345 [Candidatus Altiarchaeales archaeon WOR_SM1_SCG]|nr:hypothetical protein BEH94_07345 [Candidatus Altiarchaeales archaeon WOR_SM1_SCG]
MKIKKKYLVDYLEKIYNEKINVLKFEPLGSGCHGSGFLIEFLHNSKKERLVAKTLKSGIGLGHDHFSDRCQVLMWANDTFNNLPKHVKAVDVAGISGDGITSIGKAREFFLLMEEAKGVDYSYDLREMKNKSSLDSEDIEKIKKLTKYLAGIHSVKCTSEDAKILYFRKLRDTIGHGECLMGVLDTYPDDIKFTDYFEMAEIEKKCCDWMAKLKHKYHRCCQIHGDFHRGNIWFSDDDFTVLDRSRGEYGDAADDVTAFTINYIFSSIIHHGKLKGAYEEALRLFYEYYLKFTGDYEIMSVSALFYAFRGVVVANPMFYPDITEKQRRMLFNLVHGILDADEFKIDEVNDYVK